MSNPTPKSYDQILADIINTYQSKLGISDLAVGSAAFSLFETMAQIAYRTQGDIFQIKKDYSLDNAEGDALKKIAAEDRIYPIPSKVTTGLVTITDSSFEKLTTKVYSGASAPNIGSLLIKASDTTGWPEPGKIYIGRGTNNVEGPLDYTTINSVGGHFEINLVFATTKFHNISETITLAQKGVRTIPKNTTVSTIASGGSSSVSFTTDSQVILLDGENIVTNVSVSAQQPGTDSNITSNTIKKFSSAPFVGASVSNSTPFTDGRNEETDEEIRDRVKKARLSRGLGTATAVKSATLGVRASDENATITSNQILFDGVKTTLYIDNGNGYEAKTKGVGLEYIVDNAIGGENSFQLTTGGNQTSVAKAFLISLNSSPFQISELDKLAILVGGVVSEHQFNVGDFRANNNVTSYEVVASINSNPNLLFTASTSNSGANIVIQAIAEVSEYLQVTSASSGVDASIALGLSVSEIDTLSLYKNRKILDKDGRSAFIESDNQDLWLSSISDGITLTLAVDGTSPISYSFFNSDFINEGTYSTVSKSNSLSSWINVINSKVTGITASMDGVKLKISSNLGPNTRASIVIDPLCTFVTNGIFSDLTASGLAADYTLSRNTAQIKLNVPLSSGDNLSAGTELTKARIQSGPIIGGAFTLTSDAYLWFLIDQPTATIVNHFVSAGSLMSVSKDVTNIVRYTSNTANAFGGVLSGDYVVVWSNELDLGNRLEGRVHDVGSNYFEIKVTSTEFSSASVQSLAVWVEGLCFARTAQPLQKIKIPLGSHLISDISNTIQSSLYGSVSYTQDDEIIFVGTKTEGISGSIMLATFNIPAKAMVFSTGIDFSEPSHYGFFQTDSIDASFPSFIHSTISDDNIADPPNSEMGDFTSSISLANIEPNKIVSFLHPYNSTKDCQSATDYTQINSIATSLISIEDKDTLRRLRTNDRYALFEPLNFSHNDSIVVVMDKDVTNKTFPIPMYRNAKTNIIMPLNPSGFRAFDSDSGASVEFSEYFSNFSFNNYKVLMQAKNAINPKNNTVNEDSVLFRSTLWGKAGENIAVGYTYPAGPNQEISSIITTGAITDIKIVLKSGASINNTIDNTTEWSVTVTPNTPSLGVDTVTYNCTAGTTPGLGLLVAGSFVTINGNGEFSLGNTGTFKVISSTANSFVTLAPNGVAVNETGVATLSANTIITYSKSDTLASEIVTYANASLAGYITASLLNDNGTSGAGIISLSTYEDSSFVYRSISLKDGVNWIASTNLAAISPAAQFTFKVPLSLPSINTANITSYAFNNSESIKFIPTTAKQVSDLISVLAVSGITTVASVSNSARNSKLQLSSTILGSSGAIQIAGGFGNSLSSAVIGNSSLTGNYAKTSVIKSSINAMQVGSFVKLKASQYQKKEIGISEATNVTITPNAPSGGQSTIVLANRDIVDSYFGVAKNNVRDIGTTIYVEKHGKLICFSWDGLSGSINFTKSVEINGASGGNISVTVNIDGTTTYASLSNRNFIEAQKEDIFVISSLANSSNNGTFKVLGVSDDGLSICVDNYSGVTASSASVLSSNLTITTEIKEGDTVTISAPFASLNRGTFKIIRRFDNSFYIENENAVEEVASVALNQISFGSSATTTYNVTVSGTMKIQYNGAGTSPDFTNVKMGSFVVINGTNFSANNRGTFLVVKSGVSFIEVLNAKATAQTGVTVSGIGSDTFKAHSPSLSFFSYSTVIYGDNFVITGNVLGSTNIGSHSIIEILDKDTIVVNGMLTTQSNVGLASNYNQVYVQESALYTGYKRILNISEDPTSNLTCALTFDTSNNYEKINDVGAVQLTAMSKLSFPEQTSVGTDSYSYNTGLIGEANRIVYGDPRNSSTYPGVAAAGAEIYIKEPLIRRVQVSIDVRINTGVPFTRIVESVRDNVFSLINSSPIGVPIPISRIIASVTTISGVSSVAISSPLYNSLNDTINIKSAEKPMVLNISTDILVSRIS